MKILNTNKIRYIIRNNKTTLTNFSYLTILQIFLLFSPFITYPYLIRVLGLELNGVIVFAQSLSNYLSLVINFGFNIYGTRLISVNKHNMNFLNEIISIIYTCKFIIWILLLFLWILILVTFDFFRNYFFVYFVSYFLTFSELLIPVWLFQGLENMKYITIINISTKLFFLLFIFICVRTSYDLYWVPILNSLGSLIGGGISLWLVFSRLKFKYSLPSMCNIILYMKESAPLFLSTVSIQIYANINKLLIGSTLGMREVSIYDICEKIMILLKLPLQTIQQVIFPKISREKNISYVNKMLIWVFVINVTICIIVFFASPFIMQYMLGYIYTSGIIVLIIMSCTFIVSGLNLFLGGCRLLPWGYTNLYTKISVVNCLVFVILCTFLYGFNIVSIYTITMLNLITEIVSFILLVKYNRKLGILYDK